jgi:cytoskeletal protein CcmA (bactofilin family)
MALFGRDEKDVKSDRPAPAVDVKPQPIPVPLKEPHMIEKEKVEAGEGSDVNAYLGKGSRVSGKLNFDGTVRVDGHVEGEISAQDTLIVGESAVVTAQINGNTVIIKGKVTGDINARKRVEVRAPGKLYGNIVTPSLVIHEGVLFEGHCSMGAAESRSSVDRKVTPFVKEEKGGEGTLAKVPNEAIK